MEEKHKNHIYDRLLAMTLQIEAKDQPDPSYINECLSLCHQYLAEVEKFYIEVSQENSTLQRALNNVISEFEHKRDFLMTTDEIKDLPSVKDREAKANQKLKNYLERIKVYKNEISDLDNLNKAINLKNRNLNRINGDVKLQLRIMESQVKLGVLPASDKVSHDLLKTMKDSAIGQDVFEEIDTRAQENETVDPSAPLDVDDLLKDSTGELDVDQLLSGVAEEPQTPEENKLSPAEESDRDEESIKKLISEDVSSDLVNPDSIVEPETDHDPEEDILESPSEDVIEEAEEAFTGIDLDKVIDGGSSETPVEVPETHIKSEEGGEPEPKSESKEKTQSGPDPGTSDQKADKDGIDIDALLSQFT